MKKTKFLITALSIGLVSAAAVSCDPKTTDPVPEPTVSETITGNYAGDMTVATTGEEATVIGTEDAAFEIKNQEIIFTSFPSATIINALAPDEETAEATIEALGDVAYTIGFTAAFNTEKTEVDFTLNPQELVLSWTVDAPEEEDSTIIQVTVTFSVATPGKYVVDTKKLTFELNIDKIVVDETEVNDLPPLQISFDMTKS